MRMSGAIGGANPSSLARIAVLPHRRLPHIVAPLGDSRAAAVYVDTAQRGYTANSALNWANALLGQRLVIGQGFGKSGDRTDQVLARLPAAIASGAGLLYILAALNDIAQNVPSATTSGATAFANVRTMIDAGRAAGMVVVVEAEVGSNNLNAVQVGQVHEFNAQLFEYAERVAGVHVHDARLAVMQPGYADGTLQFREGMSYDGTHLNGRGASYAGESLATLIAMLVPPRGGVTINSRSALVGNGRRQLMLNPVFATATGGSIGTGASGTVPAGFGGVISGGGATATYGTQADPDGLGNNVVIDANFTAAGSQVRLFQDLPAANYQAGDVVQGVAVVDVVGNPTGLAALMLQFAQSTGAGGAVVEGYSLYGPVGSGQSGIDRPVRLTLQMRPFVLQPAVGSGPYLQLSVRAVAGGTGAAKIVVRQMALKRRDAAY
ncbi:MAG: GDSL-type esterase/lipase family protein [Sphingomonas paucimobilis]